MLYAGVADVEISDFSNDVVGTRAAFDSFGGEVGAKEHTATGIGGKKYVFREIGVERALSLNN